MRHIRLMVVATASLATLVAPATASATPPTPTMVATACRIDATTISVSVSWSSLAVTGGEIFVNIAPLTTGPHIAWNQKGKHGTHTETFDMGTDIADIVTVNLYNAKINDPNYFVQRVIGDGNDMEELTAC